VSRSEDAPRSMTSTDGAAEAEAAVQAERIPAPAPVTHLSIDARVAVLEVKQDVSDRRHEAADRRLARHGTVIDDHAPRIERLERVYGEVIARLTGLDLRIGKLESRLLIGLGIVNVVVEVASRLIGK
jgi:hypothetical protein